MSASRNRVSSSSVVGKTLNSTGLRMYIATIITITEVMMSVTIRTSSRKPGSGVIRAITIPSTASGTPSSFQLARSGRRPGCQRRGYRDGFGVSHCQMSSVVFEQHYAVRLPFIMLKI